MKVIKLTKNMVSLVDDDDYEELSKYKWTMGTNYGYRKEIFNGKTKNMFIQHKIMGKAQPGYVLDHINRNKLDNRKENLRFITIQQNKINSTVRRDCKSGYKGVTFCKNRTSYKKWRAALKNLNTNKLEVVGYFETAEEASIAFNARHAQLNGCYSPYFVV